MQNSLNIQQKINQPAAADIIGERVFGQSEAIQTILEYLRRPKTGLKKPRGVFIFLGPAGVGKTELAKVLAEYIYSTAVTIQRFNAEDLIPAKILKISDSARVLVIEEIEKADSEVLSKLEKLFSQPSDLLIILTSQIGSQTILEASGKITPAVRKKILGLLAYSFSPEFLDQVDEIIMFHSLTVEDLRAIVDFQLAQFSAQFIKRQIKFSISAAARDYLAEQAYAPTQGARPLNRLLQTKVFSQLTEQITQGKIKDRATVRIELKGDKIEFK